jgi:hypothetical protein
VTSPNPNKRGVCCVFLPGRHCPRAKAKLEPDESIRVGLWRPPLSRKRYASFAQRAAVARFSGHEDKVEGVAGVLRAAGI